MGRGRQKAKQTKVARELKYSVQNTDYGALERELHGSSTSPADGRVDGAEPDLDDDAEPDLRSGSLEGAGVARAASDDGAGYEDWAEQARRR